jgi:hypothetical protein
MKKINKVLKQLSDLYEFNRKIESYVLKKKEVASEHPKISMPKRSTDHQP